MIVSDSDAASLFVNSEVILPSESCETGSLFACLETSRLVGFQTTIGSVGKCHRRDFHDLQQDHLKLACMLLHGTGRATGTLALQGGVGSFYAG
jgi:hypothetical protein